MILLKPLIVRAVREVAVPEAARFAAVRAERHPRFRAWLARVSSSAAWIRRWRTRAALAACASAFGFAAALVWSITSATGWWLALGILGALGAGCCLVVGAIAWVLLCTAFEWVAPVLDATAAPRPAVTAPGGAP